jgi:hypothetical protein
MAKPTGGRFFSSKLTAVGLAVKKGPISPIKIRNMMKTNPATASRFFLALSQ